MAGHAEYWGANFHVRVGPSLCPLRENAAASNCEKNCKCRGFSNVTIFKRRWCMNRNWPTTNPTHRSITYQERTTMAYRARPSG